MIGVEKLGYFYFSLDLASKYDLLDQMTRMRVIHYSQNQTPPPKTCLVNAA